MQKNQLSLGMIPYGVVYLALPELDTTTRRRDLTTIKQLGFNTVVLWPPVCRWEGTPFGEIAFDSVDEIMDMCAELDLKVILELQGQDSQFEALPESLTFMKDLAAIQERDVISINHPEVRAAVCDYLRVVAAHFKGHPALLAYDIFNEVHYTGFEQWTVQEFVAFLQRQYGDIQTLNRKWASFFPDFETIAPYVKWCRSRTWSSAIAGRDWYRFRPYNFAERLLEWGAVIREVDPEAIILADIIGCDSMHNRNTSYGTNDWLTAETVDVHGLSCYANTFNPDWWSKDCYSWPHMWRQQLAAARGKQVIISELMTPNRTMFPQEHSSMSDQIRLWGYQALFNGIKGVIYWKYRPFCRGVQVGGRGLTDNEGTPNEFARQAAEVAGFLRHYADALAQAESDDAGCAILHDHNTQDIYQVIQPWDENFYTDAHCGIFRGLWEHGVSASFLIPSQIAAGVPERVKLLVVPCNVCVSEQTARALVEFVRGGGRLLTEGRFGLLDEDGSLYPRVPGAGMCDAFGMRERRLLSDASDSVRVGAVELNISDYLQELTLSNAAHSHLTTTAGRAALVSAEYGQGRYVHVPFLLGRKLARNVPGAAEIFAVVFDLVAEVLRPTVRVLAKKGRVDVSVLKDHAGTPFFTGIVNYEYQPTTIRLQSPRQIDRVEGDKGNEVVSTDVGFTVNVPARGVAAIFLK